MKRTNLVSLALIAALAVSSNRPAHLHRNRHVKARAAADRQRGQRYSRLRGQADAKPDIDRKFRGNIGKRWPRQKTDAVLQSLWVLERTPDIGALPATLTV